MVRTTSHCSCSPEDVERGVRNAHGIAAFGWLPRRWWLTPVGEHPLNERDLAKDVVVAPNVFDSFQSQPFDISRAVGGRRVRRSPAARGPSMYYSCCHARRHCEIGSEPGGFWFVRRPAQPETRSSRPSDAVAKSLINTVRRMDDCVSFTPARCGSSVHLLCAMSGPAGAQITRSPSHTLRRSRPRRVRDPAQAGRVR